MIIMSGAGGLKAGTSRAARGHRHREAAGMLICKTLVESGYNVFTQQFMKSAL
jgi:hypothetical protein